MIYLQPVRVLIKPSKRGTNQHEIKFKNDFQEKIKVRLRNFFRNWQNLSDIYVGAICLACIKISKKRKTLKYRYQPIRGVDSICLDGTLVVLPGAV